MMRSAGFIFSRFLKIFSKQIAMQRRADPIICTLGCPAKFGGIYYDKGKYYRHMDCRHMPNQLLQAIA